ncbi:MAG: response regulator [Gemmatimonadaceae bacterium]
MSSEETPGHDDGVTPVPFDSLASVGAALANQRYARRGVPVGSETIRVILVDDHTLLRAGIRALLRSIADIAIVGEASDGVAALDVAARLVPDVVVMDLDMGGADGLTATRAHVAHPRPPRVLILTMHMEEERLIPLLEAGASGYLAKDAADRELVDAIRAVAAGEVYVRPAVARLLASMMRDRAAPAMDPLAEQYALLSEREQLVVRLVAEGYNGPEIGRQLGISPKTVDTYKQRIEEKLGLAHRTEYVRFAVALGLLQRG